MTKFERLLSTALCVALVACDEYDAAVDEAGDGAGDTEGDDQAPQDDFVPQLAAPRAPMADDPGAYPFFARAEDLGTGEFWVVDEFSEGALELDLNVMFWDGAEWSPCNGLAPCDTNEGHLAWGMPIYSSSAATRSRAGLRSPSNARRRTAGAAAPACVGNVRPFPRPRHRESITPSRDDRPREAEIPTRLDHALDYSASRCGGISDYRAGNFNRRNRRQARQFRRVSDSRARIAAFRDKIDH